MLNDSFGAISLHTSLDACSEVIDARKELNGSKVGQGFEFFPTGARWQRWSRHRSTPGRSAKGETPPENRVKRLVLFSRFEQEFTLNIDCKRMHVPGLMAS